MTCAELVIVWHTYSMIDDGRWTMLIRLLMLYVYLASPSVRGYVRDLFGPRSTLSHVLISHFYYDCVGHPPRTSHILGAVASGLPSTSSSSTRLCTVFSTYSILSRRDSYS